jgi:hypothetical protein
MKPLIWQAISRIRLLPLLPLSLTLLLGGQQTAFGLTFGAVVIAKTGDAADFSDLNPDGTFIPGQTPGPAINASGEVAFYGDTAAGMEGGVYKGAGAGLTTIASTTNGFLDIGHAAAINNSGTVAFGGRDDSNHFGVFTGSGGALTTVKTEGAPPSGYFAFGDPSINASGRVAFYAEKDTSVDLLSKLGAATSTVAATSGAKFDQFPGSPFYGVPGLNDAGHVAFYAITDLGDPGIFESKGTTGAIANTLADTSLDLIDFRNPVINNSGRVAFWAQLDGADERILFSENEELHTVVDTLGGFAFSFQTLGDPALADDGSMAFWATLSDGKQGIFFVDSKGVISRVLGEGDSFMGSTIDELGFGNNGLNSAGELAMWAMLHNGTEVILRSVLVPEPSTGMLLAVGLMTLGLRRGRRP